jgi:hypothetical protein
VMPTSAKASREVGGCLGGTGADRGQLSVRQCLQRRGKGSRDTPGAQDPPADRFQSFLPFRFPARSSPPSRIPVGGVANLGSGSCHVSATVV